MSRTRRHGYRVLLPSENRIQIDSYMGSADRKLSRALKLSRSTPADASKDPDQTEARIIDTRAEGENKYKPAQHLGARVGLAICG